MALSAKLGKNVVFADDDTVVGENAKAAVAAMNNGDCLLYTSGINKELHQRMEEHRDLQKLVRKSSGKSKLDVYKRQIRTCCSKGARRTRCLQGTGIMNFAPT